jgi:hypothetical protein
LQEGGCGKLFGFRQRSALSLSKKSRGPLARVCESLNDGLAHRVKMMGLAHASGKLGSILPAVGEYNELANVFAPRRGDIAQQ